MDKPLYGMDVQPVSNDPNKCLTIYNLEKRMDDHTTCGHC